MATPSENKICNVNEFSDDIGHYGDMSPSVLIHRWNSLNKADLETAVVSVRFVSADVSAPIVA